MQKKIIVSGVGCCLVDLLITELILTVILCVPIFPLDVEMAD